jgi:hypothetical protein
MNEDRSESDELSDNIVQAKTYEAPMPSQAAKTNFAPWHRPRKQLVRDRQWCGEIVKLLDKRSNGAEGTVLRYLGLPGDDFLDLRHFHAKICQPRKMKVHFFGFNYSAHPQSKRNSDFNVSLAEVKDLNCVDPLSHVLGDDFAKMANRNSVAFNTVKKFGPYDVVNLDLCHGFGKRAAGSLDESYYSAVNALMALQARHPEPWLLFLTTRADPPAVHKSVLEILTKMYSENLEQHPSFQEESRQRFGIDTRQAVTDAVKGAEGLLQVFLTGVCKWFISLALGYKPQTSVQVRSVFGYRVDAGAQQEDLLSIALLFTPTTLPVEDRYGLSSNDNTTLDEGALATKALTKIASRVDADAELQRNPALLQQMTADTAELLHLARYDVEKFMEWAATA